MFLYPSNINWLEEAACAEVRCFFLHCQLSVLAFHNILFNCDQDTVFQDHR